MASSTCELIHLITEVYHRDWQTGPLKRGWMGTMLVFCLINALVDVCYLGTAYCVYDVLVRYGRPGSSASLNFLIIWCVILVDWLIEVFASVGMAVGRRGKVTPRVILIVTNIFFTAVQYGSLPLTSYFSISGLQNTNHTMVMRENPGVRCFFYLSIIQGTSYGLATYLMAAWAKEDRIRGGNLFLSILGIPYSCSIKAYHERSKMKTNWPVILVRSIIYLYLMTVLYINGILMLTYLEYLPYLEKVTGIIFFAFLFVAALPFLVASTICTFCCFCTYCCAAFS